MERLDPGTADPAWPRADAAAAKALARALDGDADRANGEQEGGGELIEPGELTEPGVVRRITAGLPADHALILASSMPVRDANRYAVTDGAAVPVLANRGASGIDGTIATAAGTVVGRNRPATLLIGDLATIHDLSSLALLQHVPVVVVLINNGGGGIFHFLPIAEHDDVFEPYFATPHPANFEAAAAAFNISYQQPSTPAELSAAYRDACSRAGGDGNSGAGRSTIIEVRTDRERNHQLHKRLDASCAEAVRSVLQ
jgi:2-succinyl-5-enolpyruvyl-6-hydroxy-3-cyclohexene-1-carboxylate synthase